MFIKQLIKRGARLSQFIAVSVVGLLCLSFLVQPAQAQPEQASIEKQLAQVRAATAQFHSTEAAKRAGYSFVPGLDSCFDNPGVGGMGFHMIKGVDLTVNALEPEAMVYAPGPNGQFQLDAVEYIVPAALWDAAGNTQPPSVRGSVFIGMQRWVCTSCMPGSGGRIL